MNFIFGEAYAKINLALDITGKTSGGYHTIESVMKKIDLRDSIFVCREDGIEALSEFAGEKTQKKYSDIFKKMQSAGIQISSFSDNCAHFPQGSENTVNKAASLFLGEIGSDEKIFIYVKKRIPSGGGLAGGSTDAACVLTSLNKLFGNPLSLRKLSSLCGKIGSDVPFFLTSSAAFVSGTGTDVKPLPDFPEMNILLVNPGFSSSTKDAYVKYDSCDVVESAHPDCEKLISDLLSGNIAKAAENMKNVLEIPVFEKFPEIKNIKDKLCTCPGIISAFMSGSGSTVVGIFASKKDAENASSIFGKNNYTVFITK